MKGFGLRTHKLLGSIFFSHFEKRFKEPDRCRPRLERSSFRKLEELDFKFLDLDFSMDELKSAVWSCAGSKAPGPDGMNFNFIKKHWDLIKSDFFIALSILNNQAV